MHVDGVLAGDNVLDGAALGLAAGLLGLGRHLCGRGVSLVGSFEVEKSSGRERKKVFLGWKKSCWSVVPAGRLVMVDWR